MGMVTLMYVASVDCFSLKEKSTLHAGSDICIFYYTQFLEEIDYSLAFKTLSDRATFNSISVKSFVFSDAMDSYYNCIWDATLLEFIVNFLAKRGEHARKQLAV